jgi:hypothetical protein
MKKAGRMTLAIVAAQLILLAVSAPAQAARPGFVFPDICCYWNDQIVRTVTPPAASPMQGTDGFYAIMDGVDGQLAVVAVAPGDAGYHGGHWAFHSVTWNVSPYLLTSSSAVLAAASAGDVTITRIPENDFKCPIQP